MAIYIELGALLAAIFVLFILMRIIKEPLVILANSILGIIAFAIVNVVFHAGIPINIWSVLAVALGGLFGFLAVLALHFLGLGF